MRMQSCKCDFCGKELFNTDYHGAGWSYPEVPRVAHKDACQDCAWEAWKYLEEKRK